MTGLLLTTLLSLSPGIQLTDGFEARHVRLVADEAVRPSLDQMTREQLVGELHRINGQRPGLGGPIATLAVGVAVIIPGLALSFGGLIALLATSAGRTMVGMASTVAGVVLTVGLVMVGVGIVLAVVGGVSLGARLKARSQNGKEADDVRRRIQGIDQGTPAPLPVPELVFPQASFVNPSAMQTVLTF